MRVEQTYKHSPPTVPLKIEDILELAKLDVSRLRRMRTCLFLAFEPLPAHLTARPMRTELFRTYTPRKKHHNTSHFKSNVAVFVYARFARSFVASTRSASSTCSPSVPPEGTTLTQKSWGAEGSGASTAAS